MAKIRLSVICPRCRRELVVDYDSQVLGNIEPMLHAAMEVAVGAHRQGDATFPPCDGQVEWGTHFMVQRLGARP